jgi:hypothetical protein
MAGNEWINGYLEAILDSRTATGGGGGGGLGGGGGGGGDPKSPAAGASPTGATSPRGPHVNFNPTHYFVEEVVKGVDESDLHRTWIKVVATRNARERSTRLENMCWRIWHLARKKKQVRSNSCSFPRLVFITFISGFVLFLSLSLIYMMLLSLPVGWSPVFLFVAVAEMLITCSSALCLRELIN